MGEIDITKNIKMIELLKSQLLSNVSEMFNAMAEGIGQPAAQKNTDALVNAVIISYLLAERLGVAYENFDKKLINKLKAGLAQDSRWELKTLLAHMTAKG